MREEARIELAPHPVVLEKKQRERRKLKTIKADAVDPKPLRPIWKKRLFLGKASLLEGAPEVGKSSIGYDIIARITQGRAMPLEREALLPASNVIYIAGDEDDLDDTVIPRLIAAGADLARVTIVPAVDVKAAEDDGFNLGFDLPALGELIESEQAAFVFFESIMSALPGKSDSTVDAEMRRVLRPLSRLASQTDSCITSIRHFRKAGAPTAVDAGGGSIAFAAVSRSLLPVGFHPEDMDLPIDERRRVLAGGKTNNTLHADSLLFRIEGWTYPKDTAIETSRIKWLETCDVTADELAQPERGEKVGDAVDYIKQLLQGGPMLSKELSTYCEQSGFSASTIQRARKKLRVKAEKNGPNWFSSLPKEGA